MPPSVMGMPESWHLMIMRVFVACVPAVCSVASVTCWATGTPASGPACVMLEALEMVSAVTPYTGRSRPRLATTESDVDIATSEPGDRRWHYCLSAASRASPA